MTALYGPFGNVRKLPEADSPQALYGVITLLSLLLAIVSTTLLVQQLRNPVTEASYPHTLMSAQANTPGTQQVTRGTPPDLLSPTDHPLADLLRALEPNASPVFAALPKNIEAPLHDAVAEIQRKSQQDFERHMRMLREAMLAGVYTVEARMTDGAPQLSLRPVNLELSRDFLKTLMQAAADRGEVSFPEGISRADGTVDLDTMLFNLVQNRLASDGTSDGAEAAQEMARRAANAAVVESTTGPKGERIYVVKPGDSLAYISLRFYGRPGAYTRIFQANRSKLKSPDQIRIGQRLLIPG